MANENPSVFVVWDSQRQPLRLLLESLVRDYGSAWSIAVPGLGDPAEETLRDVVLRKLMGAEVVLVATDQANVNVGFMAGIAAGFGKELLFFQQRPLGLASAATHWMQLGPMTNIIAHPVDDASALVALLAQPGNRIRWPRFEPNDSHRRGLFLCPTEHEGAACRMVCSRANPEWVVIDRQRYSHDDLLSVCDEVGSIVWTLTHDPEGVDDGHGSENAANAVLAGWFFAGMLLQGSDTPNDELVRANWELASQSLKVLRSTAIPRCVDLGTLERTFQGLEAYERQLHAAHESIEYVPIARATPRVRYLSKWTETPDYANAQERRLGEDLDRAYLEQYEAFYALDQARANGENPTSLEHEISSLEAEIQNLRRLMQESAGLKPGQRLCDGRYRLTRPLGHGGIASVWLASDRYEQREVAIKVMHEHLGRDSTRREQFQRGASVMAQLNHHAVVQVLQEAQEDSGYLYFVMECVGGLTYAEAVLHQALPQRRIVEIVRDIADALSQAHDRDSYHRDLTPANILLDRAGSPKLTDLELLGERDVSWATRTSAMGSGLYTSPDILSSKRRYAAADDVYSLGLCLLFGLKGEGEDWYVLVGERDQTIGKLECHDELKGILLTATHRDWQRRYQHARELREALDTYLELWEPDAVAALAPEAVLPGPDEVAAISAQQALPSPEAAGAPADVSVPDQPMDAVTNALPLEPEDGSALRSLEQVFTQAEQWANLADLLEREAESGESTEEILDFKYRLGQVCQHRLGDLDRAILAYRDVIGTAPEHTATLEALEGLFEAGTKRPEIAAILEPLYQAGAEWEKLVRLREAQLAYTADPNTRIALYHRIAEDAEERLLDAPLAFAVQVRALKERPLDEHTGAELERLAATTDSGWEDLANAYADVLDLGGDTPAIRAIIGQRLARVFEEELADIAKAKDTWRYVLAVAPGEALANLDRIHTSLEEWSDVAAVLEQRAARALATAEQVELLTRLGEVYEEKLGQIDDAIRPYRKIFDQLEPANEAAIQALGRIYEVREEWHELQGVYERELENAPGDVAESEIRAKLARLASERLGKVDETIEGWKRVLELRGDDREALEALADLYQRQRKWAELTDVLDRHFDLAETDEDRVAILMRRARLCWEQLGRDDEALETWQRVLDIDPYNVAALGAIAQIWRARGDPRELVNALEACIDRAGSLLEPTERREIYRELGRTYGDVLGSGYEAAEAWRSLLGVDATDFEAMDRLEASYRAEERWAEVVDVKIQRSQALPEPEERIRELLAAARIWREVEEHDRATPAYEKILELQPSHPVAFGELEQLHASAGRWEHLIELYLNRLETRDTAAEKCDLLRRIARVFEEKLADENQAFDALVNAFAEDYGDDESVGYLERMAQATGRWGELIATANTWLGEQTEDRPKIQLCLRLGKWYGENLDHPDYAQPYYATVTQLDPSNVQVRRRIAAIHRMSNNWQQMGEELTRALDVATVADDRKAILHELGELLERHVGQRENGIAFYRRALEVDPLHLPTLEALERIYDEQGSHAELVGILAAKTRALTEPEAIATHRLRMGSLFESLGNPDKAAQTYQEVLEIDPLNLSALQGLERVHGALKKWPELVRVLEQQLEVVETERERVEVLLKLANLQEEQFLKPELAALRLEQALELDTGEMRAYESLERCYQRLKQWPDLVNTYQRHLGESLDLPEKIRLYFAMARVYTDELGDLDGAIDAYRTLVDLDATNIPALEALARLYEKQGDAPQAVDAMARVAELSTDGAQKVEMLYRIGKTLDEQMSARSQAQERFEMALDLDPAHLPSLAALRNLAADEADWDRAARYLDQEQLHTPVPRARARLLVELGNLRDEMLGEHAQAVQAYELALECDDDCEDAALPLLQEYSRLERWWAAEPLAELLVKKAKGRERHEQHRLYHMHGQVLAALLKYDKALKAYQTAHQLDLTDQETIRGIAEVAFELKDWPTSLTSYQKVLTALGDSDAEQRTDIYFRLGSIKREQGQVRQAINNYEKGLGLTHGHRPTLDALVEIYTKLNDWKQVAAYQRQILDGLFESEDRYVLLNEIGEVWAEKEKNVAKAVEAYEEALELKPQDHVLLHRLLQLYNQKSDWQKMVETVQAIADLEERPEVKARYFYTMAQLYRDKLEDPERAVDLFNQALDSSPTDLDSFERINKLLSDQKNWQELERAYHKMIQRIAGQGNVDLESTLWHQLGLLYRDRLELLQEAIECFKAASVIKPEVIPEHQILAELYETTEQLDDALREQRIILAADPTDVAPYRAIYRLLLHQQAYDHAWCLAAAMAFLGKADEEETRFFQDYAPESILSVRGSLTREHWVKHLMHPGENLLVSKIMEMITPAALQAKIAQLRVQGKLPTLDPRFKQDPANSSLAFARVFGQAALVLGIPAPELYVRSDAPGSLACVPALVPASTAGRTVLTGLQPQELAFICGQHLCHYRSEHYIRTLFPTQAELTILLFAGVMLAFPATPMPADMLPQIQATARELAKYLQPVELEGLRHFVKRFVDEGAKANIKVWNQSVELTACRAGLLLSGDLEIARKLIGSEPQLPGDLTPADKLRELVLFSVSDDYTALRQALGVAVGQEP